MGTLLIDQISQAQSSQKMISLHTTSGNTFLGYVLNLNPELLLLRSITRQGLLTGVRSIKMEDISRVDFDDRYIRLVEFKEHNPEIAIGQPTTPDVSATDYLTMTSLLQKAQQSRQLVFLETGGDYDFYGYVSDVSDDELLLEVYTQYGEADGKTVLAIDFIRNVIWSDEITRTIELLLRDNPAGASRWG
ncbi:hypothetical protein GCM10022409_03100 [Hymenobacter glaciei]|uniref:Uncharacterized protein n=1 Tax=Hymenobacter glaciei TaxID=877209 RepID=A0ABP7T943_9BACT